MRDLTGKAKNSTLRARVAMISVIVPAFNAATTIDLCLDALALGVGISLGLPGLFRRKADQRNE